MDGRMHEEGEQAMRDDTRSRVSAMAERARERAGDTTDAAREKAAGAVDRQKERATGQLASISSALRQTSGSLRHEDQDTVASYVERAASQVDRMSDYLRTRSIGDLLDEAQDFARREPALFLGGAFLLGLAGSRFMRSSKRHLHDMRGDDRLEPVGLRGSFETSTETGRMPYETPGTRPGQGQGPEQSRFQTTRSAPTGAAQGPSGTGGPAAPGSPRGTDW